MSTVTVTQEQLNTLVEQRNNLATENAELKESINRVADVVHFVKNKILGGKFPESEKEMNAIFYAKIGKNLLSVGFNFGKKPEQFVTLVDSLKYLIEVMPKYMSDEQLKRLSNNE